MTTLGELLRGEVRQKAVLKTPIHGTKKSRCTLLRLGALGPPSPHLERGLWVVSKANAWWTSHLCNPVELILKLSARYKNGSQVQSELGTKYMMDSLRQTKLYEIESGFGNFECYFTCGERLLVCEIERYALDIQPYIHTQYVLWHQTSWFAVVSLLLTGILTGDRSQAGVGILVSSGWGPCSWSCFQWTEGLPFESQLDLGPKVNYRVCNCLPSVQAMYFQ